MSLLDDLASKLVADGLGVLGTTLFLSSNALLPAGAGPLISLNETGGMQPSRTQNTRIATQHPTVQVLVRADTYSHARAKAWDVFSSLDGNFNLDLNGVRYLKIVARQEPTDMGIDSTGLRVQVVFNLEIEKVPS